MHQTHPSTACGTAPPGKNKRTTAGRWCRREASQGSTQARREYPPRHRGWQERPDRRGSPSAGCRQARRRGGRAGGGGDKRAQARGSKKCVCLTGGPQKIGESQNRCATIINVTKHSAACNGHTIQNTPDPIRTPKLSCVEGSHGNPQCRCVLFCFCSPNQGSTAIILHISGLSWVL